MFTIKVFQKLFVCLIAILAVANSASANDRLRWEFKNGYYEQTKPGHWIVVVNNVPKYRLIEIFAALPDHLELAIEGNQKIKIILTRNQSYVLNPNKQPPLQKQYDGKWIFPAPTGPKAQALARADISGKWIGVQNNWIYVISQKKSGKSFGWTVQSNGETAEGTVKDHKKLTIDWISGRGKWGLPGEVTATDNSGRPTVIKWGNGVVFERMIGGGGSGAPANPGNPTNPIPKTVDISGRWTGHFGIQYDILRQGNGFTWKVPGLLLETAYVTVHPDRKVTGHLGNVLEDVR